MPTVLLTGGTGYIGSHTSVELSSAGYNTVLFDNLCNSSAAVIDRIEKITGKRPLFVEGDIRDRATLDRLFADYRIDAVVHFAGLKAVADSVARPLNYYLNNVSGSATLIDAMSTHGVRHLVFSSSATVYDPNAQMPLKETSPTRPVNPYGRTKLMIEEMLEDIRNADPQWRIMCLRYFNPVGAHETGLIGEDPRDRPNNLMPYVAQVAVGRLARLEIFGNDYPTPDGTGVRDYIHVSDLATAHVAALDRLSIEGASGPAVINVGTGRGFSVLDVVRAFEQASGRHISYALVARRPGDVATSYADAALASESLGWRAQRGLIQMCADAWRWQERNPNGYAS
jgi:UDP-glucose 4-epimerase